MTHDELRIKHNAYIRRSLEEGEAYEDLASFEEFCATMHMLANPS